MRLLEPKRLRAGPCCQPPCSTERGTKRGKKNKSTTLKTHGRAQPSHCLSHVGRHHGGLLHRYARDAPSSCCRHHGAAALPLIAPKPNTVATAAQRKWRTTAGDQPSGGKHPWPCRETCFLPGLQGETWRYPKGTRLREELAHLQRGRSTGKAGPGLQQPVLTAGGEPKPTDVHRRSATGCSLVLSLRGT